jgi:hypothetical protein
MGLSTTKKPYHHLPVRTLDSWKGILHNSSKVSIRELSITFFFFCILFLNMNRVKDSHISEESLQNKRERLMHGKVRERVDVEHGATGG